MHDCYTFSSVSIFYNIKSYDKGMDVRGFDGFLNIRVLFATTVSLIFCVIFSCFR